MQNSNRLAILPILTLIIVALMVGLATFRDYGESFDEGEIYWYGEYSLKSYYKMLKGNEIKDFELPNLNHYGPSFFMLASLLANAEKSTFPNLTLAQSWHFIYFITFLFGGLALYALARRWLSSLAAFGTSALYITQPILWGHAFINPKDIPFMSFFLVSVIAGLWMCDKLFLPNKPREKAPVFWKSIKHLAQTGKTFLGSKKAYSAAIVWAFLILLVWVFSSSINWAIAFFISSMYSASPQSLLGYWFAQIAPNAKGIPAENYIYKATTLIYYTKLIFSSLGVFFGILTVYKQSPYRLKALENITTSLSNLLSKWPIAIAGIALGLTTSIRVLGPLAGIIVGMYAFWKYGRKAILSLLAYSVIAILMMYSTWPYLWNAPLTKLYQSAIMMASYPWIGQVLFNGEYYPPTNLPWFYLPVLFLVQFTEPTILLFMAGSIIIFVGWARQTKMDFMLIILLWFIIPITGLIITKRPLYDNFRQILFLLPPVFLICGVALEYIFQHLSKMAWKAIIIFVIALPGLYGIFSLHPYQYVYFNSTIGGTGGAFQKYEMDYWLTSYKEAVDFLNRSAPKGATIFVPIGSHLVHPRPDLSIKQTLDPLFSKYDYAILTARDKWLDYFPEDRIVYTVQKDGAILAVVKQSSNDSP